MTRRDWWLGIAIVLVALAAAAFFITRAVNQVEDAHVPRLRPVGVTAEVRPTYARPRFLPDPDAFPVDTARDLVTSRYVLSWDKQ